MNTTPAHTDSAAPAARQSVHRTRIGGWWVALVVAALVLLLLLIFVLQNGQSAHVSFLGAHGSLPLGIALLLAAIAGVLIVAVPGSGRILQLRRLARRPADLDGHDRPASPEAPLADPANADPAGTSAGTSGEGGQHR